MLTTDVLVIGAGPSGTVAAAIIKRAGFDVRIVEKLQFPRFVIGESLLPRCLDSLERAGFMPALNAMGFQEKNGAKFVRKGEVCDFSFEEQFTTSGRKYAWQMPRADFDKCLADTCETMGIPVMYRQEVTDIKINDDGSSITTIKDEVTNDSYEIKAKFIVDGSGYGRVIPRLFGLENPSTQQTRKTIFAHLTDPVRMEQEEPNRIVVFVPEDDVWIWTIPFSNGNTSVGFVASPEFFERFTTEELYAKFREMLAIEPVLATRFANADFIFEPRILQAWSATTNTFYGNGFVLTGNVTEFLDPIFSSGVTLATVSADKAAQLVIKHLKGEPVDWEQEYMQPTMKGVNVFRTYVNAWYNGDLFKIFFSDKKTAEVKERICSVLAGYVWDDENTFVAHHDKSIKAVVKYLETFNN